MFMCTKSVHKTWTSVRIGICDNKPIIPDLSDQSRPTRVAEKMSELYVDEWKDACDALGRQNMAERQRCQTLLDILMVVYDECSRLASEDFFERVQASIELPKEVRHTVISSVALPYQLKQYVIEFRKLRAPFVVKEIEKVVRERINMANQHVGEIQKYTSNCIEIGWLCAVQNPPLVLNAQASIGFDTNTFKDYTCGGKYTEYVVWPALYLHDGGVLLAKGIAQGCNQVRPSNTSASTNKGFVAVQSTKTIQR